MKILVKGLGASPGKISGIVKIAYTVKEAERKLKKGEILVVSMTDPSYVTVMKKASAIITNTGGILCHAAIVARELNIPCVVGTKNATETLKDGMKVIVDGLKGVVYEADST
jgi:pyruvate,water dikinase